MKVAQLKACETAFTSAGKHEPVIFSFLTHDPSLQVHISAHNIIMIVMHSAHNERKQETIVKRLLEIKVQVKK